METKDEFIRLSLEYGDALEYGDDKIANKKHGQLTKLYEIFKLNNDFSILEDTSDHFDERVQFCASVFLLRHNPKKAIEILNKLTLSKTMIGFSSKTTLSMWNKGMFD